MKQITCRVISVNCDKTGQMAAFEEFSQEDFIKWTRRICEGMISMEIEDNYIKVRFPERYEIYEMKDTTNKTVYNKEILEFEDDEESEDN